MRRVVGAGEEVREVVGLLLREVEGIEARGEVIVDIAEWNKAGWSRSVAQQTEETISQACDFIPHA